MYKNLISQRSLRSALLAGVAVSVAGTATVALAQDEASRREKIVVTGSRIPERNLTTTSPISQVTAEDVQIQGVTKVEDLMQQMPQIFISQNSTVSNGATGTATVSLRGLGASRTLVLIDGRRMPYGSPIDPAADLNQIPGPLVERVEVLTGGASAVYGSDALAGVVNFIMKSDFEGLRIDSQYSFYQHSNDYDGPFNLRQVIAQRALTNPAQFRLPDDNVDDGWSKEVTGIVGASTDDDRGNVTAYYSYRKNDQILQAHRDYSACALGNPLPPTGPATCGGSSTSFPGRFTDFLTYNFTIDQITGNWTPFIGAQHQYNYGPLNYYIRPDERHSLGAFAHYDINEHVEAYAQLMFTDYFSIGQIAPSGDFFSTGTINCENPFLYAPFMPPGNSLLIGCPAAPAPGVVSMYIGRRNVEGGGRQDHLSYASYRGVGGVRGQIIEGWDYDVSAQWSKVNLSRVYRNDFSVTRLNRALDVVDADPGPGIDPQCRSKVDGTDPNCVPWNIFTPGAVTDAALNYLQIPLIQVGNTTQRVVSAEITGDLSTIGMSSPWAEDPFETAFGIEWRRDEIDTETDVAYQTGDGAGQGGPTIGLTGETDVWDLFIEARLPILQGREFAELLSFDLGYRYSSYDTGVSTDTYKTAGEYAPTEDIRFRASYQRAVRAANVIELFTAQGFNLFDMDDDPCDTTDPAGDGTAPIANCQVGVGTHLVTPAQAGGGGLTSPAGQYNFLQGGNPNLSPEVADTYTLGFVFTPTFLENLVVSVDWFEIKIDNTIANVSPLDTITACYFFADAASCAKIFRNPGTGQLWIGAGNVEALNTNIGGLSTTGIDVNAQYSFEVGDMGGIQLAFMGTWLDELISDPGLPFSPAYDCAGFYANQCGTPNPEWRHRFRVTWATPWDAELNITWRYYGEVDLFEGNPARLDYHFDAENYIDLAGSMSLTENVAIRAGVNNVFDNDPPLSASVGTTGNGNTYPQSYDAMGRYIFMGMTVDF